MSTVQQAYIKIKKNAGNLKLRSILDFGSDFGFLFGDAEGNIMHGGSYILINKKTEKLSLLPTTPNNVTQLQSAKKIPLTALKIR